jgi:hypothetical protein
MAINKEAKTTKNHPIIRLVPLPSDLARQVGLRPDKAWQTKFVGPARWRLP